MSSAWGKSWGTSWGASWGRVEAAQGRVSYLECRVKDTTDARKERLLAEDEIVLAFVRSFMETVNAAS